LLQFIPKCFDNINDILATVTEIDSLMLTGNELSTTLYEELMMDQLHSEIYFSSKLMETSPGFNYIYNLKADQPLQVHHELFKYLGYDEPAFEGNKMFFPQIIHPDDAAKADAYLEAFKSAEQGEVRFFEYRLMDASGNYKWMRNYESVYRKEETEVLELIGIAFDITIEKTTSEALQQREEALLEAQTLAHLGSYVWDFRGQHTTTTKEAAAILELQPGEKLDSFMERVHVDDKAKVIAAIEAAMKGEADYFCEYRYVTSNKTKMISSRGKIEFENGEPAYMKGTIMDITEKQELIDQLLYSEQQYKQAQRLSKIGNWIWDLNTNDLQWSEALYEIYGLERTSGITITDALDFVHPADKEIAEDHIQKCMLSLQPHEAYVRAILKDGSEKVLLVRAEVMVNEYNIPVKLVGTTQDVTEQRKLELYAQETTFELKRANLIHDQLQQLNEYKDQFIGVASHELKTPLTSIKGYLQLAERNLVDNENKMLLNKTLKQVDKLTTLVSDLLDVSRIQSGKLQFSVETFSLNQLLAEAVENVNVTQQTHQVTLTVAEEVEVEADKMRIEQVLMNVLNNAVKYSPDHKTINVRMSKLDKEAIISVQDQGIGIDKDFHKHIFRRFHRIANENRFSGLGLGLFISYEIIKRHEGKMWLESEPGKGSTFYFSVPLINRESKIIAKHRAAVSN
jgi:PAS domain S-box-containing protein